MANQTLAKQYQKKTDREHILDAPDTYIGSVDSSETFGWIYHEDSSNPRVTFKKFDWIPGLYKLFDEGVVNSSSTFQDVQGLLKDIAKGGDFIERAFGKLGKRMNKVFRGAQDLYVAEDDFYKIYN